MNDDQDLVKLRPAAALLRKEIDVARLVANVVERVRTTTTVTGWLDRWFRPVVVTATIAIAIGCAGLYQQTSQMPDPASAAETQILTEAANVLP
jgi:hypothetical protein